MAFAPTRSGKGVGLVIPTLLSWTGSAVIHDIKGENRQLTAGSGRSSRTACGSIRPIRARPPTTRSWRCVGERRGPRCPKHLLVDPRRRAGAAVTKLRFVTNDNRDSDNAPAFRGLSDSLVSAMHGKHALPAIARRAICASGSTIQASASRSAPRTFHRRTATPRSSCGIGGARLAHEC
jgi:Type IV secretory system Conjugative DNA transfer